MAEDSVKRKEDKDSYIVMIATLISRVLGIVKARAISAVFGASGIADVINFTFNIPNNFRKLFAEGAVSAAFRAETAQATFWHLTDCPTAYFYPAHYTDSVIFVRNHYSYCRFQRNWTN